MAECLDGAAWRDFYGLIKPFAADDGSFPAKSTRQATDAWRNDEIDTDTLRAVIDMWRNDCTLADAAEVVDMTAVSTTPRIRTDAIVTVAGGTGSGEVDVLFTVDGGSQTTVTKQVDGSGTFRPEWEAEPGEYEVCAEVVSVRP